VNAKSRIVKTAPVIAAVEYVLMISSQRLPFSTESYVALGMLEHALFRSGEIGDAGRI
jgi:hypothetical protein